MEANNRSSARFRKLIAGVGFAVLLFFGLGQLRAQAEEIKVQKGDSIQKAIDRSNSGDVLVIMPGVYKENITIGKEIVIKGEEGAVIDGGAVGNVVTITAADVTVDGLVIVNSGSQQEDSGVYVRKGNGVVIRKNKIKNVHNGIYIANSSANQVVENEISSDHSHFSKRGNGIHLFKGDKHLLKGNEISEVQDGIYYDFTHQIRTVENEITHSRYGMHFMFSEEVAAEKNTIGENVTGFMVMDSRNIQFNSNKVMDQFHFRGFGFLIYESKNVFVNNNEIIRNSTGISIEHSEEVMSNRNLIAANQVGLELLGGNKQNAFTENNFIGNIVQSKISMSSTRLDDGERGNYWDDYTSFDLSGDGIGEEAYKAGSLYDQLLQKQPYWQFFFESPSVKLWTKAESLFPSIGAVNVYDARPLTEPVSLCCEREEQRAESLWTAVAGMLFIFVSFSVIVKGRKLL